jgi:predicted PurR-regulated permease PerM
MLKQVAILGAAVMTALLALVVLWQFHIAVIYLLISLALAATFRPLAAYLTGRRLAVRLALILLYVAGLGGFCFLVSRAARFASHDIQQVAQALSVRGEWGLPAWLEGTTFQKAVLVWLPPPSKLFEALAGSRAQIVLPAMLGFTRGIGEVISGVLVVTFLSIYWSINQVHFERLWLSLLPPGQRKKARDIWRTIEANLGGYIRSELIQSFLAVLLLGLGYYLLGSPYSTLLALAGALAWLIPVVGGPLAVIPPLLMGMLTSVQLGLLTALYTLIVLIVLQVWVEPRLFKRKWDNPILTLVILLALAKAFGLLGIIIAPPLSGMCRIVWNLLFRSRIVSEAVCQVSDLKERLARLRTTIGEMDEPPPPLVISSMNRLAELLENAEPTLHAALQAAPPEAPRPPQS